MYAAVRNSKSEKHGDFIRQGSLRRVLPSETNKENVFGKQHEDLNKFYKCFYQEYAILAEYKMLQSENLEGVYVIPSRENSLVWFGVVFVRSGLYEDGIFRFDIILPENFPEGDRPKVIFTSEVYHPVINGNTNELNLNDGFPQWNKGEQHIWQILKYIHWIFHNLNASIVHGINKEAISTYKSDGNAFKKTVEMLVKKSQELAYHVPSDVDKHYIIFEPYDRQKHDEIKASMLLKERQSEQERIKVVVGHSWVTRGSLKPLSRPPSDIEE